MVENCADKVTRLTVVLVCCVALLPEEFASPKEGGRVLELPPHDVGPLVDFQWEVTVGVDPLCERRLHDGLRGRADSNRFV